MKRIFLSTFLVAALICVGCGGGTQYKDPAKAEGSMAWGPKEIIETVNKMVGSLHTYLKQDWNKAALLQVQRIRNRTSEHIDTNMLADEIVTNLLKKRIQFVDPSYSKEAIEEIEKGMTGLIDPAYAIPIGKLQSPNFFLFGEISDNVRFVGGKRVQYLVVTLKLKSITTGRLHWQEQQKFLKSTKTDKVSW